MQVEGKEVIWNPQKGSQEKYLQCPLFEVLYTGTRGPGKTDALIMDFCQHVGQGFGAAWKGLIFRQTYPQLQDVIAKTKKWIPRIWPTAKYNEAAHHWRFPGGEMLLLRHFKRDEDYWNYHGHEYPFIGWEELTNWNSPKGYKRMISCCRSTRPGMPRKYRATTNPYGVGHNWIKQRFRLPGWMMVPIMDAKDEEGNLEPPRIAIHGSLMENRILMESDPGYIDRLRSAARNKAELAAWIEGSWDIVAGGMFDDTWDSKYNMMEPFKIPDGWRIDRSFDWGSSKPFSVGWWAESDGGDIYLPNSQKYFSTVRGDVFRINEWYGWSGEPNEGLRMLATDITKGIIERELRWQLYGRVKPGPADNSIHDVENGMSIANDMAKSVRINGKMYPGISWTGSDKSPGSRKAGWEGMRKMMRNARPINGLPREQPGIFVFRNCDQFLRTVPVLPRDEKDLDDVDTDTEDHIADETRYRIRSAGNRVRTGATTGMY